jgi:hypothetical protein
LVKERCLFDGVADFSRGYFRRSCFVGQTIWQVLNMFFIEHLPKRKRRSKETSSVLASPYISEQPQRLGLFLAVYFVRNGQFFATLGATSC